MELIEFSQAQKLTREQAAQVLRDLADQLSRHNELSFVQGGLKTSVKVPSEVTLEVEIEVGDESELEIEIRW